MISGLFKFCPLSNLRCSLCPVLRRLPLTPWESSVVNRLQQPTHSYLARSRSAMSLSGEQTGTVHTALLRRGLDVDVKYFTQELKIIYTIYIVSVLTRAVWDVNRIKPDLKH